MEKIKVSNRMIYLCNKQMRNHWLKGCILFLGILIWGLLGMASIIYAQDTPDFSDGSEAEQPDLSEEADDMPESSPPEPIPETDTDLDVDSIEESNTDADPEPEQTEEPEREEGVEDLWETMEDDTAFTEETPKEPEEKKRRRKPGTRHFSMALNIGFPIVGGDYARVTSERIPVVNLAGRFHFDRFGIPGLYAGIGVYFFSYTLDEGRVPGDDRNLSVIHVPASLLAGYQIKIHKKAGFCFELEGVLDSSVVSKGDRTTAGNLAGLLPRFSFTYHIIPDLKIQMSYGAYIIFDPNSAKLIHFVTVGASYAIF
jgi:hypothetical protein